jgi:hypothetical protein
MDAENILGMMMDVDCENRAETEQVTASKATDTDNNQVAPTESGETSDFEAELAEIDLWSDAEVPSSSKKKRALEDEDYVDDANDDMPVKKTRGSGNKVFQRRVGRQPKPAQKVRDGLTYEDGGVIHFKVNSAVTSTKINMGKSIRNFQVEYASAKISEKAITVELEVPKLMGSIKVNLNAPTMKELLHAIQKVYKRPLTNKEMEKIVVPGMTTGRTLRLYHMLGKRVYYAGLKKVNDDVFRVKLKKETDNFNDN